MINLTIQLISSSWNCSFRTLLFVSQNNWKKIWRVCSFLTKVWSSFASSLLFFIISEMSGTVEDISQVHWKQQWLENGTLYFHVSITESELQAQTTQPTAREPAHALPEHMHLLHISVMVSIVWRLLLLLRILNLSTSALGTCYSDKRECKKIPDAVILSRSCSLQLSDFFRN